MKPEWITEWILASTALIAVLINPYVAYYVAKKQFKASVISPSRQKWICELRDQISELLTHLKILNIDIYLPPEKKAKDFPDRIEKAIFIGTKIKLLMNPNEDDHKKLLENIETATNEVFKRKESFDSRLLMEASKSIIAQSQIILKREWEKVKD